eukprot:snap_masked-scaffold_17-processed-gene-2.43-mRNA-1 protein AED:1.00 eAED:1.00 QI:0/-1/0/0/-1/1/1/0/454
MFQKDEKLTNKGQVLAAVLSLRNDRKKLINQSEERRVATAGRNESRSINRNRKGKDSKKVLLHQPLNPKRVLLKKVVIEKDRFNKLKARLESRTRELLIKSQELKILAQEMHDFDKINGNETKSAKKLNELRRKIDVNAERLKKSRLKFRQLRHMFLLKRSKSEKIDEEVSSVDEIVLKLDKDLAELKIHRDELKAGCKQINEQYIKRIDFFDKEKQKREQALKEKELILGKVEKAKQLRASILIPKKQTRRGNEEQNDFTDEQTALGLGNLQTESDFFKVLQKLLGVEGVGKVIERFNSQKEINNVLGKEMEEQENELKKVDELIELKKKEINGFMNRDHTKRNRKKNDVATKKLDTLQVVKQKLREQYTNSVDENYSLEVKLSQIKVCLDFLVSQANEHDINKEFNLPKTQSNKLRRKSSTKSLEVNKDSARFHISGALSQLKTTLQSLKSS